MTMATTSLCPTRGKVERSTIISDEGRVYGRTRMGENMLDLYIRETQRGQCVGI